jgi:1-phosphofructokinase family hexose kinase
LLIATPNLCLDRTQFLAELVPGAVMRPTEVEVTAGGKGVNIARVVRAFGGRPVLAGLVADGSREQLLGLLEGEGTEVAAVPMPGYTRMANVMVEAAAGRITVVNEPGTPLPQGVWERYADTVATHLTGRRILICSGSLPPGAPVDGYGQLVELAHRAGVPVVVDTAPQALRAALAGGPDLVCPNVQEAEAALAGGSGAVLADAEENVRERALTAARDLVLAGARTAAVTAGGDGVALAAGGRAEWIGTVPVRVVSAVGAGDSFVAGIALAFPRLADPRAPTAQEWRTAVVRGVATATASCEQLRAGGVDRERVEALLGQVTARNAIMAPQHSQPPQDPTTSGARP